MKRSEAREWAFKLIFESQFHPELTFGELYENAEGIDGFQKDKFTETLFEGVSACSPDLDELIGKYSKGWSSERMSKVSLAILRLSVFELKYLEDVPMSVSINEAIELTKKFDDPKARAFVNGVLNAVKDKLEAQE